MKHVIEDAMNPGRREAIRSAFEDLQEVGEEPRNTMFALPARARRSQERFSATTIASPVL